MAKGAISSPVDPNREKEVWFGKQILKASLAGELQVFTSTLTIAECTHAEGVINDEVMKLFTKLLTSGQYVILIQPTPEIAIRGRDLRWVYGINLKRGADHIHVASALAYGCTEYLSTEFKNRNLESKAKVEGLGLRIVAPSETQLLPNDYTQLPMPITGE